MGTLQTAAPAETPIPICMGGKGTNDLKRKFTSLSQTGMLTNQGVAASTSRSSSIEVDLFSRIYKQQAPTGSIQSNTYEQEFDMHLKEASLGLSSDPLD